MDKIDELIETMTEVMNMDITLEAIQSDMGGIKYWICEHIIPSINTFSVLILTHIIVGIGIMTIIGGIIIWNQRKIKKMLHELQEQMKQQSQTEP